MAQAIVPVSMKPAATIATVMPAQRRTQ